MGGVSWEGHSNLGAPKPSDKDAFEYMCGNCNSGILLKGTKLAERDLKPLIGPRGVTICGWTYNTNGCRKKQQKQTAALTVYTVGVTSQKANLKRWQFNIK